MRLWCVLVVMAVRDDSLIATMGVARPCILFGHKQITTKERADCELFYLSFVNKHGPRNEETRLREHPRWSELYNSASIHCITVKLFV